MAQGKICCCGASVWTKIIAWANIITNLIVMVPFASASFYDLSIYFEEGLDSNPFLVSAWSGDDLLGLIILLVGFSMGILLLVGSHKRKPGLLLVWLIYAWVHLAAVIGFFSSVTDRMEEQDRKRAAKLMRIYIVAIQLPCIWVVRRHRKEMKEETVDTECLLLLPPREDV